ncbi:mannitol-1-phosphate 5-dehydrogenase [Alicyclobacillus dauci]|uniref:Mannitol-1-phosphate 5-dehydrogenase n=1 Tax=Alicyclobacillus dauci TaxID=1475485 RepID=A0ABY6Z4W5_9BACL|nr:mannitol-1-phosphate 5-dehydrogenase [Alicyclobacillus dauci]WAH37890.1 mannitol-1-phosphate 5-dehydrogenase [Alicyclobacillus dauci]
MKKAVHFGAGNIGRGFIGLLLHRAGYEVVFADVVASLIDDINASHAYRIIVLDEDVQTETVDNVRAVLLDSAACRQELVDAEIITTAVGLGNLANLAAIIAEGLKLRRDQNPSAVVNIMACENAIRATTTLKQEILSHSDAELTAWIENHVGFADVAVDRIAPNRAGYASEPLDAVVERYFEWDIEAPTLKGDVTIPGATFVQQLDPYLERKLFILNGAHATAAFAGYRKHYATILDAMQDSEIANIVTRVQHEAIIGLVNRYPEFNMETLGRYAESVRARFLNPHILDDVARVGRDPLRKLSAQDRLVRPLLLARQVSEETPGLVNAIALGLCYDNPGDEAAVQLQQKLRDFGVKETVTRITGISQETILDEIVAAFDKWQVFA